jgi:hypothetical protein
MHKLPVYASQINQRINKKTYRRDRNHRRRRHSLYQIEENTSLSDPAANKTKNYKGNYCFIKKRRATYRCHHLLRSRRRHHRNHHRHLLDRSRLATPALAGPRLPSGPDHRARSRSTYDRLLRRLQMASLRSKSHGPCRNRGPWA